MGKRTEGQFERVDRDFYPTPMAAVRPLTPYLQHVDAFCEPFAGNGDLIRHLAAYGHRCALATDIEPGPRAIAEHAAEKLDAMDLRAADLEDCSHIISNPPWPMPRAKGEPVRGLIHHLAGLRPTWLLLSADFKHNVYAVEPMTYCRLVVSIGRVKWIEGSEHSGVDNAAWYLFVRSQPGPTIFCTSAGRPAVYARGIEDLL